MSKYLLVFPEKNMCTLPGNPKRIFINQSTVDQVISSLVMSK